MLLLEDPAIVFLLLSILLLRMFLFLLFLLDVKRPSACGESNVSRRHSGGGGGGDGAK